MTSPDGRNDYANFVPNFNPPRLKEFPPPDAVLVTPAGFSCWHKSPAIAPAAAGPPRCARRSHANAGSRAACCGCGLQSPPPPADPFGVRSSRARGCSHTNGPALHPAGSCSWNNARPFACSLSADEIRRETLFRSGSAPVRHQPAMQGDRSKSAVRLRLTLNHLDLHDAQSLPGRWRCGGGTADGDGRKSVGSAAAAIL